MPAKTKPEELLGVRYGRLVIIEHLGLTGACGKRQVRVRCDCGNEKAVMVALLRRGTTQSCGCLHRERAGDANRTHKLSATPIYRIWQAMHNRCKGTIKKSRKHYFDRGIKVCDRWNSFKNFYADMGQRPSPKHTVERIDNNGNYEPGNCRWATRAEQSLNTSVNRRISFDGQSLTAGEWAAQIGIKRQTIVQRLRRGWSIERTLTTPLMDRGTT